MVCGFVATAAPGAEIGRITANGREIIISGRAGREKIGIAELAPYQGTNDLAGVPVVSEVEGKRSFNLRIPRFDGPRDRLYSGFAAFTTTNGVRRAGGEVHYVEDMRGVAKYDDTFLRVASKKGLQVQMTDDAIALGVKHAGLNVDLAALVDLGGEGPARRRGSWMESLIIFGRRMSMRSTRE